MFMGRGIMNLSITPSVGNKPKHKKRTTSKLAVTNEKAARRLLNNAVYQRKATTYSGNRKARSVERTPVKKLGGAPVSCPERLNFFKPGVDLATNLEYSSKLAKVKKQKSLELKDLKKKDKADKKQSRKKLEQEVSGLF